MFENFRWSGRKGEVAVPDNAHRDEGCPMPPAPDVVTRKVELEFLNRRESDHATYIAQIEKARQYYLGEADQYEDASYPGWGADDFLKLLEELAERDPEVARYVPTAEEQERRKAA
jgi:hypothetical protein